MTVQGSESDQTVTVVTKEVTFPREEWPACRQRLESGEVLFTTRVSAEVRRYHVGEVYESVFGNLRVGCRQHFDDLSQHPFLQELTRGQIQEIEKYIDEGGADLVGFVLEDVLTARWRVRREQIAKTKNSSRQDNQIGEQKMSPKTSRECPDKC